MLCLADIVFIQTNEGDEPQSVLTEVALEGIEILQQNIPSLFNTPYFVIVLCLSIHLTHLRIVLRPCGAE